MTDMPETAWLGHRGLGKPGERVGTWAEWIAPSATKYVRSDIHQALQAEKEALLGVIEAAQWARNRLEMIADNSWHGDGRDLKRSIEGVFSNFHRALENSGLNTALAAIDEKDAGV